jgi:hypothetical protein
MVYSRAERVSILKQFLSKSFAAVREAFINAIPDKEVLNKTVQNVGTQEVFVCDQCLSSDKTDEITAVHISNSASAVATGYGYKNSIVPLVSCVKGFMCNS